MNLKHRLITQNFIILVGTLAITLCLTMIFYYFYGQVESIPAFSASVRTDVIALRDGEVMFFSNGYSDMQVKEILMNISMNKFTYDNKENGLRYDIRMEDFHPRGKDMMTIVKLTPIIRFGDFYKTMLTFIAFAFLAAYLAANLLVLRYNSRNIINPIEKLIRQTEKLADGELSGGVVEEGYGEVRELGHAVEMLRLRLKDSVYYKEKYDENRKFLISSISHDLRTPVTAVKGYVEGILDGVANTPEKQKSYLLSAREKTKLIAVMIDDLLLYSKLDLNQIPFDIEKTDLVAYIRDSVEDNRMAFEKEGKVIEMDEPSFGAMVAIDPARFRRVVQNVLDNAKKHIAEDTGRVTVRFRETGKSVVMEFRDNGPGISREDLPHIFDRFYRGDASRRIEGSSGLGLAIAKLVVEGLSGRIWAVSEKEQGTGIMISLKKL